MTLAVFSDLHLDNYRRFSTTSDNGLNSRLLSQVNVVQELIKVTQMHQVEAILFLGDLFNGQGATINKALYVLGYNLISQLKDVAPLYLLVGNHDMYGLTHMLAPMADMPNVQVIDSIELINIGGMNITCVPWGSPVPKVNFADSPLLVGHLDVEGFRTGTGYELPGTISPKALKDYKLVISGHYHSYQEMSPNIVYCGSIMPITFGDIAGDDYGCVFVEPDLSYRRHIIDSPKFIPITINNSGDMDRFVGNKAGNYYRLTITDRKVTVPKFDHTVEIDWDIKEEMKARLEYEVDTPLEEVLCKYIDQANTKVDKEHAKSLLREVMKEC